MNSIYVSFNLKPLSTCITTNEVIESDYQSVYKPLVKFLYSHPEFSFSFSFSGYQLQFFRKRKTEFCTILKELINRKQVEILGGGFYDPVLPLLSPVDRNGQIDLMSGEIRQTLGKRPRGITLFADCWDSSLVGSLQTCGIEYVLLDSFLIPSTKHKYLPLIMHDFGKSIQIFPTYDNLKPSTEVEIESYILNLVKTVERAEKKNNFIGHAPERIVNISLTHENVLRLIEGDFFEKFHDYISKTQECRLRTIVPTQYNKNPGVQIPAYIPAGINGSIAKWISRAFTEIAPKQNEYRTVYDFMETYPQAHSLNNRIMYVSMLINQFKKDKMRKNAAREKLWHAQNGTGLLCTSKGAFSNSRYRQQSYKYLMEAEKILRTEDSFKEAVNCFDYNYDGLNEYVCRMQNYFSYITLIGGAIQELDILKNTGNYADNLSRVLEYEACADDYARGIFVDHVFSQEQFDKYINGEPAGNGVFSQMQYSEYHYSQNRHEIQLSAEAIFHPTKQKISLRKKYLVNSTGMIVQYILKNESEKPLSLKLAVESNFAHTNFDPENISYYNLEVVDNSEIIHVDTTESTCKLNKKGKLSKVNMIRLTDVESGISFGLEPNELSGFYFNPMIFRRPDFDGEDIVPVSMTFVNTLFWNINLEPGRESEKTINFTITAVKKERKKAKTI